MCFRSLKSRWNWEPVKLLSDRAEFSPSVSPKQLRQHLTCRIKAQQLQPHLRIKRKDLIKPGVTPVLTQVPHHQQQQQQHSSSSCVIDAVIRTSRCLQSFGTFVLTYQTCRLLLLSQFNHHKVQHIHTSTPFLGLLNTTLSQLQFLLLQ